MTTATSETRRTTKPAANWRDHAACRGTDPEAFFSDKRDDRNAARRVCAGCPVITQCLKSVRQHDEVSYQWGIGGGLDPEQRQALAAEELLGRRPEWRAAQWLARTRGQWLLHAYRGAGRSLAGTTVRVREEMVAVDEVTVRVALWLVGESPSRLEPKESDGRRLLAQITADHAGEVRSLRDAGATCAQVATYLGVPRTTTVVAVRRLEAEDMGVAA